MKSTEEVIAAVEVRQREANKIKLELDPTKRETWSRQLSLDVPQMESTKTVLHCPNMQTYFCFRVNQRYKKLEAATSSLNPNWVPLALRFVRKKRDFTTLKKGFASVQPRQPADVLKGLRAFSNKQRAGTKKSAHISPDSSVGYSEEELASVDSLIDQLEEDSSVEDEFIGEEEDWIETYNAKHQVRTSQAKKVSRGWQVPVTMDLLRQLTSLAGSTTRTTDELSLDLIFYVIDFVKVAKKMET